MTTSDSPAAAPANPEPSPVARVRRKPGRARYDLPTVHAVLDAAPFCHVATVRNGRPVVLPMAHGRLGDLLVLHGSPVAGLFRDTGAGSPVCITATLLDGLVLARSARNHSMNYRSATIHGRATRITEPRMLTAGLQAIVDHLTPGRWAEVRKPTNAELRETAMWQVPITQASVKSRSGPALDPEDDRALPTWAGHIPAQLTFGRPVPADGLLPGARLPGYLDALLISQPSDVPTVPHGLAGSVSGNGSYAALVQPATRDATDDYTARE
jgi:uncharacterized protein